MKEPNIVRCLHEVEVDFNTFAIPWNSTIRNAVMATQEHRRPFSPGAVESPRYRFLDAEVGIVSLNTCAVACPLEKMLNGLLSFYRSKNYRQNARRSSHFLCKMALNKSYIATAVVLCLCSLFASSTLVVVQQDDSRRGYVEGLDDNGDLSIHSSFDFLFSAPYVQMSMNTETQETYLSAFPDGNSYPVLSIFNPDLSVSYQFDNNTFTFWDMQYCAAQHTIYGILVTEDFNGGMSGRTLSNFSADQTTGVITPTELYTLPYMWYVNASSINPETSYYYALVNNFPGHENSTQDQKLVIGDFSVQNDAAVTVLDIAEEQVMMQFIAFSRSEGLLYFSGPSKKSGTTDVTVGVLCQKHGTIHAVLYAADDAVAVGPIVADDANSRVVFFVKTAASPNEWTLMAVNYAEGSTAEKLHLYEGEMYASFGAAAVM